MTQLPKHARLHEKVVQQIAQRALPNVQGRHTTQGEAVAQKVSITLVDDLDGSSAAETVTFGLDNTSYEIDLSSANAEVMRKNFAMYVEVARKVTGRKKAKKSAHSAADIRKWAADQGMEVSNRGVVPVGIVQAYEAAH